MIEIINAAFKSMLLDFIGLAAGCLILFAANLRLKKKPALRPAGRIENAFAIAACSLIGIALPFGPFGAVPVMAALWLSGFELPLVLPLLVSNFIFNLSMPLADAVFVWNGNLPRIAAAFAAGALAGALLSVRGVNERETFRGSAYLNLFTAQRGKTNYFKILGSYAETAGLFIVAGAVLKASLSAELIYRLQNLFFASYVGSSAIGLIAKLNVFSPLFGSSLQILERLVDFSSLACLVMLFRVKPLIRLYVLYIAIALVLAASLFFK